MEGISEELANSAGSCRSVQRLLWGAISERLKEAERDEVKRAIGAALVDENTQLFAEANALIEILGDVQLTNSVHLARKQLCSNPERTMIETDILLLMDKLRACSVSAMFASSSAKDRDPENAVPKAEPQDKAVYNYITSGSRRPSSSSSALLQVGGSPIRRPSTATSRPMTAASISRPSTANSISSGSTSMALQDPSQVVSGVQDKLNIFSIDEVKEAIQCALQEERAALLDDIECLTSLLTQETDTQVSVSSAPPALQELKQYCTKLKSLVATEESRLQHEKLVSSMFSAAKGEASKARRLRRMVDASRDTQQGDANGVQTLHSVRATSAPTVQPVCSKEALRPDGQHGISTSYFPARPNSSGAVSCSDTELKIDGLRDSRTSSCVSLPVPQTTQSVTVNSSLECIEQVPSPSGIQRSSISKRAVIHRLGALNNDANQEIMPAVLSTHTGLMQAMHAIQDVDALSDVATTMPVSGTQTNVAKSLPGGLHNGIKPNKQPVGSLIDAQIDLLRGGVASILAKHNYHSSVLDASTQQASQ